MPARLPAFLLLFVVTAPAGGLAEEASPPLAAPLIQTQARRLIDPACFCWAHGEKFNPGEQACLKSPQGSRLATCGMVTNLMSWSFTAQPCPES